MQQAGRGGRHRDALPLHLCEDSPTDGGTAMNEECAQPEMLPEISRGLRSIATIPRSPITTDTTLKGSRNPTHGESLRHPFRVRSHFTFTGGIASVGRSTPG